MDGPRIRPTRHKTRQPQEGSARLSFCIGAADGLQVAQPIHLRSRLSIQVVDLA